MPTTLIDLKLDLRAITKEMKDPFASLEVNRRDTLQYINTEYKVIPSSSPYRIRLDELPDKDSGLTISGYTENLALPTQAGQFYVDWVMGYVWFHSSDADKVVQPIYFGKGSLVDAEDMNKVYEHLGVARGITNALRPRPQDTANKSIWIEPGFFFIGTTRVNYLGNSNVRLGTGGEYQVSALTANYYNKILFTVNGSALLKKYEGTQAQTKETVVAPSLPAGEMPVCMVTVQDDGTGGAGTIKDVQGSDITDYRAFLKAPVTEHRYLTAHLEGFPILNDVFFDGHYFAEAVIIDKITLSARSAPSGSNLQIEILKNGVATGKVATLNAGSLYQSTTLSPGLSFAASDRLGLKVVAVDSGETAEGLGVLLGYY
ncbi:MAG TPA: hypothetical protein ACFYEA_02520 [Candidatus Tripitaka californicus]|uniref:hypothetical protein n=1 Tax=Candidatus Tripitaka californicus TaxID=3367616 RepID=UPI004028FAA0|nr:hypothetical protein [Planctomycetota bacterium]